MTALDATGVTLAFLPGHWEWAIIGLLGLLFFGGRLPSVARSVGDAIREFKKGVSDIGDDTRDTGSRSIPPREQPRAFEASRPPVDSSGEDQRVSQSS